MFPESSVKFSFLRPTQSTQNNPATSQRGSTTPIDPPPDGLTKPRESRFELLRIVAMIMVVWSHFVPADIYMSEFTQLRSALGAIGNSLFFIIAGYFSVQSFKPQRILKIFLPVWFYSIAYFLYLALFHDSQTFATLQLSSTFDYFNYFLTGNTWFPVGYITLYFIGHLLFFIYRRHSYTIKILITLALIPLGNFIYFQLCIPLAQSLFHIQLQVQGKIVDYSLYSIAYLGCFAAGILAFRIRGPIQIALAISLMLSAFVIAPFYLLPITLIGQILAILIFGLFLNLSFFNKIVNFIAKNVYDIYLTHGICSAVFFSLFGYQTNSLLGWTTQSTLGLILYPLLILIITFGIGIGLGILRTWLFKQIGILWYRLFGRRSTAE